MSYFPPQPSVNDPNNSSSVALGIGAVFTGTATDVSAYATVQVGVISDVASATNGLSLQFSDEVTPTHWDFVAATTYPGGSVGVTVPSGRRARWFRVVYTNGGTGQASFRLTTRLTPIALELTKRFLSMPPTDSQLALLTNSVISGKSVFANKYINVLTDNAGNLQVGFGTGGSSVDAFGRARVGNPTTLFNSNFIYNAQPLLWDTVVTGGGTATKTANVSSVTLNTGGTTNGDGVYMQTHRYYRYEPGKSQLIMFTGVLGAQKANVRSRYGYYEVNDGCYFEMDGTNGPAINIRTHTSGSPVDAPVLQASWNLDKMDGTGNTGITLDFSKQQIFVIDLQWLGTGRVRFGFVFNGVLVYAHQFLNDNRFTLPYMNTAQLPLRAEIFNTGTAASGTTMTMVCGSIVSEGGEESPNALQFTANNGVTPVAVTTRRAILSIRPKTTFNSIANHVPLRDLSVSLYADATVLYEIVHGGSLGGAPSFADVDTTNCGAEKDVAGTTVTGGVVIASGYLSVAGGSNKNNIDIPMTQELLCTISAAGAADNFSIVCTSFTGTANCAASITFQERR
jgi:hypothetical protein